MAIMYGWSNRRKLKLIVKKKTGRKALADIANDKSRSNSQGWPEMAKTLRDVDEEKIEDTKEDIDTLLVFAGLFAAVLAPFLVETYQTLAEDPGDTSVAIQRHMSTQLSSYMMMNGFLNSTVSAYPADDPSFVLPPFALSINVLWFASLTLAVVTASFGILVKQWLREYMAIETSRGAKARLRVRQFRVTALDDWKVFDIAAILPLLLQFSLGLFFVGLCFFSWSVHPTIGRTTTSIVSAWGVFFFFAIIAPACSARCPYKTALLKKPMRVLRRCISNYQITRHIYLGPVKESGAPMEDEDAATDTKGNVQILTAADAILLDDDLLATTMFDSLEDIKSPVEVIGFVVAAIQQRLPASGHITRPIVSLDLRRLPERTWTALVKITAQTLKRNRILRSKSTNDLEEWEKDAITILSTFYPSTFMSEAGDALTLCMNTALIPTCQLIGRAQNLLMGHKSLDSHRSEHLGPHQWLLYILELLRCLPSRPDIALPLNDVLQTIFRLVIAIPDLCDNTCNHDSSRNDLGQLLSAHADRLQNSIISVIGPILIEHRNRVSASVRESNPMYGDYESLTIAAGGALKNDCFLHDALPAAVNHHEATAADSMKLILGVIRNRQKQNIPLYGLTCLLELKDISGDAWTTIMNVTAQLLNDTLDSPRYSDASYSDWEVWMKDAVLVLLSLSEHPMTEEGCRTLVRCTSSSEDRQSVIHQLLEQIAGYEGYRRVFERLHSASSPLMFFRLEETTSGGINFIQSSVCNGECAHGSGLGEMYKAHQDQLPVFHRVAHFLMASATAAKICLGETSLCGLDDLLIAIISADLSYGIRYNRVHIAISASACAMADIHVLDSTYRRLNSTDRCQLLETINGVFGQRRWRHIDENHPMVAVFNVAFLYLHLMCLQISAGIVLTGEFGWWGLSLFDLIGEFKHFQTLQIQLEQDNVSIVEAAGKCLDLLGSQPDRSAIETFVKKTSRHWQEYEFKDLIRALKAFIPKDKVSRYPILDTLQ